jgi:hypothetical protein
MAGIALFFTSQSADRSERWPRVAGLVAASFLLLVLSRAWYFLNWWDVSISGAGQHPPSLTAQLAMLVPRNSRPYLILTTFAPLINLCYYVILPVIGSAYFAGLRRTRREQALWEAALAGHVGSDEFLATMRGMVDSRIEDVGFHLRYAEMLFARGDLRGAAVEARLLLEQDPYHFNGNLLLANASAALGLWDECARVCDDYLQVAGYCFEFGELRQQCRARLGQP